MVSSKRRDRYNVSPLEAVILIHHVVASKDADNDAERTVEELVTEIDTFDGTLSRSVLESALYCCNMENEREDFWHPRSWEFKRFVKELLPPQDMYHEYYNRIIERSKV